MKGFRSVAWRERLLVLLLILLMPVFAWRPLTELSPAFDEIAHIGAARHLFLTGSNALNIEHPPFAKRLAAWGMAAIDGEYLRDAPVAEGLDQWNAGTALLFPEGIERTSLLRAARLPFVLLAMLGAIGVWLFARRLAGPIAGFAALSLFVGSPAVHAQSAMVLTDLPLAVTGIWTLLFIGLALQERALARRLAWWGAAGAAAALAALSKASGVLFPLVAVGVACMAVPLRAERWSAALPAPLMGIACVFLGVLLAFVGVAGFDPGLSEYAQAFAARGHNYRPEYPWYAMGAFSSSPFLWYFPLTILLKSTPAELLAVLLCVGGLFAPTLYRQLSRGQVVGVLLLAAVAMTYLVALMADAPNRGHRYVLPVYPALHILGGVVVAHCLARRAVLLASGLGVLQAASAVTAQPDPLSYFNGLAGCRGPTAAFCLDDSNVDWGQNVSRIWPAIAHRLAPNEYPVIVAFGPTPLDPYIPRRLEALATDLEVPRPALYVISSHLMARFQTMGEGFHASPLLSARSPRDAIGNSYFVIDLRAPKDARSAGAREFQ